MKILGLDFETTGLDVNRDSIIEIGAVLWETDRQIPLDIHSCFVNWGDIEITEKITEITHITRDDIIEHGVDPLTAFFKLNDMIRKSDAIAGHNVINYDIRILKSTLDRFQLSFIEKPVIDTMIDIPIPLNLKSKTLSSMLFANEILNYFPHRAFSDSLCTLKLLQKFDIKTAFERTKYPVVKVIANVSYAEKDLPKNCGFLWNPDSKEWFSEMRECDYSIEKFNFKTSLKRLL